MAFFGRFFHIKRQVFRKITKNRKLEETGRNQLFQPQNFGQKQSIFFNKFWAKMNLFDNKSKSNVKIYWLERNHVYWTSAKTWKQNFAENGQKGSFYGLKYFKNNLFWHFHHLFCSFPSPKKDLFHLQKSHFLPSSSHE